MRSFYVGHVRRIERSRRGINFEDANESPSVVDGARAQTQGDSLNFQRLLGVLGDGSGETSTLVRLG